MGYGDQIMATGMAKGANLRGKKIAFGDGKKILWDKTSFAVFQNNPNIALPGSENARNIEWINYYKGSRIYNMIDASRSRWSWNMDFRPIPGELYFTKDELARAAVHGKNMIVIEPNVETWKNVVSNKQWQFERYQEVADKLKAAGHDVVQFSYAKTERMLYGVRVVETPNFRQAMACLSFAKMYVGTEGGLHHAAAAMDVSAVVLFGGFVPPQVTGYPFHSNLTGGATEFCGLLSPCKHCRDAMDAISVDEVLANVDRQLERVAA